MGFMWFAVITGVGGGTVRDLILNVPVFWVQTLAHVEERTQGLSWRLEPWLRKALHTAATTGFSVRTTKRLIVELLGFFRIHLFAPQRVSAPDLLDS